MECRAEKEWGDGIRGMSLTAARYALLRLEEAEPHTKNWRPQILILVKPTDENLPKYRKLFSFASQLKAGKGLTVCVSVVSGEFTKKANKAAETKANIRRIMEEERVKGFVEVLVARNTVDGLSSMYESIQFMCLILISSFLFIFFTCFRVSFSICL